MKDIKTNFDYHHTVDDLSDSLDFVFADIYMLEPKVIFDQNPITDDSVTKVKKFSPYGSLFYGPYEIIIGTKSLWQNMYENFVRDDDYVRIVKAALHEKFHVFIKTQLYMGCDVPDQVRNMARVSLASTFLPEYYTSGYYCNPEEVKCEALAIGQLDRFFSDHPVMFDWQDVLLRSHGAHCNFVSGFDSYSNLCDMLDKRVISSYYDSRINATVLSCDQRSSAFNEIARRFDVLLSILEASNGVEEVNIINSYIAEYHPEYYRGFQCIKDEYKVNNLRTRVEDVIDMALNIKPHDILDDFGLGE